MRQPHGNISLKLSWYFRRHNPLSANREKMLNTVMSSMATNQRSRIDLPQ